VNYVDPFQTAVKMGLHRHPILIFEEHPDMDNTHWLTDLPVMSCKKHKVGPTPGECHVLSSSSSLLLEPSRWVMEIRLHRFDLCAQVWSKEVIMFLIHVLFFTYSPKVLCSGGTMGSREGMLEYLNVMIEEFTDWISQPDCRMQGYGDDQAVHNYLFYAGRFGNSTKAIPHRTGPIHVVGYEASNINEKATERAKGRGLADVPRDFYVKYAWQKWLPEEYGLLNSDSGMVANLDGLPSAQVHQYDRFGNLIDGWLGKMQEQGWPYNNSTFGYT
jgi:hypothetical protein